MTDFIIRPYEPLTDRPMVINSWMMSAIDMSPMRMFPESMARRAYSTAIMNCLARSKTWVYSIPNESDSIAGWLCHDNYILHYCYVKMAYRHHGYCRELATHAQQQTGQTLTTFSSWPRVEGNEMIKKSWRYFPESFWDTLTIGEVSKQLDTK